jgi:hypothetical protein
MSIYNEVGQRGFLASTIDGVTNMGPTAGLWFNSGGTAVVVLAGEANMTVTTSFTVFAGTWLPISIKKWVSGPADTVGIAI